MDEKFRPIRVGELLAGDYEFVIPSFQRGYRWEEKQVKDLIEDFKSFIDSKQKSYYLQPLVVKRRRGEEGHKYEVLDGQQRLTTILILLHVLYSKMDEDNKAYYDGKLYNITYSKRPKIDFDKLDDIDQRAGMDNYYVYKAYQYIRTEVGKMVGNDTRYKTGITYALFHTDETEPLVRFIWYEVEDDNELNAIKIFNNLNKGKISLTSSELIKALFILRREKDGADSKLQQLSLEWDNMERRFADEDFWSFISNNNPDIQTRIDVLFDFLAQKPSNNTDSDYSYRVLQKIFDGKDDDIVPDTLKAVHFEDLWEKVKGVYYLMSHWYEDVTLYNYIGFLIKYEKTPSEIYLEMEKGKTEKDTDWEYSDTIALLQRMIKELFNKNASIEAIRDLSYSDAHDWRYLRMALLLFNVETYNKAGLRFPFAKFNAEKWDLEHIDSQTENNIVENEDRLRWLKFVIKALQMDEQKGGCDLIKEAITLGNTLEEDGKDTGNKFPAFYSKIVAYFSDPSSSTEEDKHSIDNLALLDQSTNRSYHNAPFPYKRYCIINRDKQGLFVPICTRNLFLKYYTSSDKASSQLQAMRWNQKDQQHYMAAICETLSPFFN